MPEFLRSAFASDESLGLTTLVVRQSLALLMGCIVGLVYRLAQTSGGVVGRRQQAEMLSTLVLLTVLISMMTAVIGDNIARAFAIVGALSIVRFRTVIEDTRDTAFVIFAVAVGMAVGAGHFLIPVITIPLVAIAAMIFRPRGGSFRGVDSRAQPIEYRLSIRCGSGADIVNRVCDQVESISTTAILAGMESARQGAAYEYSYILTLDRSDQASALIAAIDAIDGVQNVELRRN